MRSLITRAARFRCNPVKITDVFSELVLLTLKATQDCANLFATTNKQAELKQVVDLLETYRELGFEWHVAASS
jgi:hypothetical protein